jgi:hypothetical protein
MRHKAAEITCGTDASVPESNEKTSVTVKTWKVKVKAQNGQACMDPTRGLFDRFDTVDRDD